MGVDGNGLAGGCVWPDVPPPPVVNSVPVVHGETGETAHNCPKVFTVCSVTLRYLFIYFLFFLIPFSLFFGSSQTASSTLPPSSVVEKDL